MILVIYMKTTRPIGQTFALEPWIFCRRKIWDESVCNASDHVVTKTPPKVFWPIYNWNKLS